MQVRCNACSTTFVVGDDIVRIVRKRGGTVPCRSCKAPITIEGAPIAETPKAAAVTPVEAKPAEPTRPKPGEPFRPKPAEQPKAKPVEPTRPKPAPVGGPSRVPAAPTVPHASAPKAPAPVLAHPPAAAGPHAPPPLPVRRPSDKTRSLPPPVRSMAPKPPVPISADEWVEAEPEEASAAEPPRARVVPPLPTTSTLTLSESPPGALVMVAKTEAPPPDSIMLSKSEFPPAAVVTLSTSEAPSPLVAPGAERSAPPPLPTSAVADVAKSSAGDSSLPTPTVTSSTIDVVPPAPLLPNVPLVDADVSAPRTKGKTRIVLAFAAALLAGVGLVAIIHARSGSSEAGTAKNIAPRDEPRSPTPVAVPSPPASALAAPVASVEAPAASVEAPAPAASVEAPSAAAPVEAPAPAEKKGPSSIETPPSEPVAAQKPSAPSPAAAPRAAPAERVPETDLSGVQAAKPTKVDSRADDDALQQALAEAAGRAKGCRDATSPTGVASVSVTIGSSGDATGAVVQGPPFAHTLEGECIAAKFRAIHIPAFRGDSINVRKSVSLQ